MKQFAIEKFDKGSLKTKHLQRQRHFTADILTAFLIFLFAYTCVSKILDYRLFTVLTSFTPYIKLLAPKYVWIIPAIEMLVIFLLIFRKFRLPGLYAAATLMLGTAIYRLTFLISGRHLPCSCGPYIRKMTEVQHVIYSFVIPILCVLTVVLYLNKSKQAKFQ